MAMPVAESQSSGGRPESVVAVGLNHDDAAVRIANFPESETKGDRRGAPRGVIGIVMASPNAATSKCASIVQTW